MFRSARLGLASRLLLGTVVAATAAPALAQDDADLVVTATRRARPIQDIPVAVTAINAEQLTRGGVTDVRQLMSQTPSLITTTSASPAAGTVVRIRGIGTTGDNPGLESAVGIFIDGVFRNRNNVGLTDLGEIERIEVLRGPQGTLFGRNTSAGLISVTTQGPEFENEFRADASYGNYNFYRFAGSATGPVSDQLALRLDANYTNREGFLENVAGGGEYQDRDRYLVRGQALWAPTDDIDIRFIADYAEQTEECCAAIQFRPSLTVRSPTRLQDGRLVSTPAGGPSGVILAALGGNVPTDLDEYDVSANDDIGYQTDVEQYGVSAEVNWRLQDIGTLTSITAYRDWEATRSQDADFTNVRLLHRPRGAQTNSFETFTQEARLQGEIGQLDYLVGIFYLDEEQLLSDRIITDRDFDRYWSRRFTGTDAGFLNGINALSAAAGLAPLPTVFRNGDGIQRDNHTTETESFAVFTHNTFNLTEEFSVTAGLRYTDETKEYEANLNAQNIGCERVQALVTAGIPQAVGLLPAICLSNLVNPSVNGRLSGERDEQEFGGIFSLAYDVSEENLPEGFVDLLFYSTYSRGYKSGGFNLDRAALSNNFSPNAPALPGFALNDPRRIAETSRQLQFEPEFIDSYEIGVKSRFLDGAVTLNVTGFYQDITDFQLNAFNGISFTVINLPEAKSTGVETELTLAPTDELLLRVGATWNHATYGDNVGIVNDSTAPLIGRRLTNAALWTVTTGVDYDTLIPGTEIPIFLNVNARYTSDVNTGSDLDPEKLQQDVVTVNARLGITSPDGMYSLEVFGTNIFDRRYTQISFDSVVQDTNLAFHTFPSEPAFYGVTGRVRF